jgi:hypothetical protein
MSIKGKGYFSLRILGMGILFLIFSILFIKDLLLFGAILEKIVFSLIVSPWFLMYLALKFEVSPFSTYKLSVFLMVFLYWIIFNLMISINFISISRGYYMILRGMLLILLITSWNFSLSIYKQKKLIFITSSSISLLLLIISQVVYPTFSNWIFSIISSIGLLIGLFLIVFSEYLLRKKGLLTYI